MFNFFKKFPVLFYNNNVAVNVLARIKFTEAAKRANAIYYPYTIQEGERADVIAANYYDDPRYSWVIYLANNIIDPVYEWPFTDDELNKFIIKKYGTVTKAVENILFWRVNWYEDETILTPSGYNALPSANKKYFAPREGANGNVVAYERAKTDLAVETNKIQELTLSSTTGYVKGENISQKTSGVVTATATIKNIVGNLLIVQHVIGTFAATAGSVGSVIGSNSNTSSPLSSVSTLSTPIAASELVYWTPVNAYDYENDLNEQKRHIKLIDKVYIDQIEKELEDLL